MVESSGMKESVDHTPFIKVDGKPFFADRFYINAVTRPETPPDGHDNDGVITFSRGKLVEELANQGKLQACILATFNLDLPDLEQEFPCLFRSSSSSSRPPIETLILTGDARIHRGYPLQSDGSAEAYPISKFIKQNSDTEPPHWEYEQMNEHVQVQQVVCYTSEGIRTMGKFHPKFLLLFTSDQVYVVISTSNLDAQTTLDLSWVQAFPRRPPPPASMSSSSSSSSFGQYLHDLLLHVDNSMSMWAGTQAKADRPGIQWNSPLRFLKRVLGSSYIDRVFDFSSAAVDLITSVPCKDDDEEEEEKRAKGSSSSKEGAKPTLLYGLNRMEELLRKYWQEDIPESCKMASMVDEDYDDDGGARIEPSDVLRIQVTSISSPSGNNGDEPTPKDVLVEALRLLIPDIDDQERRDRRVELIWPTLSYIKTCRRLRFKYRRDIREDRQVDYTTQKLGGSMFWIPADCRILFEYWKDLRTFELHPKIDPAHAPHLRSKDTYQVKRWTNVVPHLKTYSRALPGVQIKGQEGGETLAWLWLTSANLSAGALGFEGIGVKNFEMGVLFHSSTTKGILYRTWPTTMTTSSSSPAVQDPVLGEWDHCRVVELPLPYRLDSPMYAVQEDDDEEEDNPTPDLALPPYFHSYHDMMLTPRLNLLDPIIQKIFSELRQDFRELEETQGLSAEGWPLHGNIRRGMTMITANENQGGLGTTVGLSKDVKKQQKFIPSSLRQEDDDVENKRARISTSPPC